jgi:hypothetical protein
LATNLNEACAVRAMSTDVAVVLEHLCRGWTVFPLEPGGKRPLFVSGYGRVRWRQLDRMTSAGVLDAWTRFPDANVAIDCGRSGLLVVDIGDAGAWRGLLDEVGVTEPRTLTVRTARGRHLYFASEGEL